MAGFFLLVVIAVSTVTLCLSLVAWAMVRRTGRGGNGPTCASVGCEKDGMMSCVCGAKQGDEPAKGMFGESSESNSCA